MGERRLNEMKLTKEGFNGNETRLVYWSQIESHTAECVAEAVAEARTELLKTHFEIGETVILVDSIGRRIPGQFVIRDSENSFIWSIDETCSIIRPTKTRPMTDSELRDALDRGGVGTYRISEYSRPTLEAMAKDLGISIEVEEV
jgi:hypothetical protein